MHRLLLLSGALAMLGACAATPDGLPDPTEESYRRALADAQNPEPGEVARDLVRIRPGEPDQDWSPDSKVLVVAWRTAPGDWKPGPVTLDHDDVWVTVHPELQRICSQPGFAAGTTLQKRLAEFLGLPPGAANDTFVELRVEPAHLFRPCPDGEIRDRTCGLAFPPDTPADHRRWINDLRARQYCHAPHADPPSPGYPWTQLGYTYDWGAAHSGHRGASEFVLRKGSQAEVVRKVPTAEYCRAAL